jgi:predicted RNA-binding Zn-ribbon protein involved in translation (DUF1610 family)
MNTDFITLTCPSCGGKLKTSQNTTSYKCPNCGNEHIIRQVDQNVHELYARCPDCLRNDKVEKVSSIIYTQTQELNGTVPITKSYTDKDGRTSSYTAYQGFTGTQTTTLAQNLQPPNQPKKPKKHSLPMYFLLGYLILMCCEGIVGLLYMVFYSHNIDFILVLLYVFLSLVILALMIYLIIVWKKRAKKETNSFPFRITKYQNDMFSWQSAIINWKNLYYCFRDGCVFLPNRNWSSPIEKMKEYIFTINETSPVISPQLENTPPPLTFPPPLTEINPPQLN